MLGGMNMIKIALIQLNNYYSNQNEACNKATEYIEEAAKHGATLAILPELSNSGYIPNQSIWKFAENRNGKTKTWATKLSKKLNIFIGAGYIETDGNDFYNAYLISNPNGEVDGVIYKEDAESYCFKRENGKLFIDTTIGRIGVGICADNHYIDRLKRIKKENIDIMLMPHANPMPYRTTKQISKKDLELFDKQPFVIARTYSKYLGVPTIYVNAVGTFPKFSGGIGVKNFNKDFRLMGGSLAVDNEGVLIEKMNDKENMSIVEVSLEKNDSKTIDPIIYHKKWLHPGNRLFRSFVLPYVTNKGIKNYHKNKKIYLQGIEKPERKD